MTNQPHAPMTRERLGEIAKNAKLAGGPYAKGNFVGKRLNEDIPDLIAALTAAWTLLGRLYPVLDMMGGKEQDYADEIMELLPPDWSR